MRYTMFPPYNAHQHNAGQFVSEFAAVKLEKWAHPQLEEAAADVYKTAANMKISIDQMKAMLLKQFSEKKSAYDVACEFLLASNYKQWIPSKTECVVGQGLSDGECAWCPQATY